MYSSSSRHELMKRFFNGVTIDKSIIELVLTSVCQTNIRETCLFSRYNLWGNSNRNYSYVDSVMATSATPTFFNSHKIHDEYYIDGGVQMNNPTMKACTEAIRYGVIEKDIFVLWLGTVIYAADPLVMGDNQGLLHWLPVTNKFWKLHKNQISMLICTTYSKIDIKDGNLFFRNQSD